MTRSDLIDLAAPLERAFLIAVESGHDDGWTAEDSLAELASLADTAGAEVVGAEWQHRRHIDPNWYLGKGKAEELRVARQETGFTLLVADDELSPNQQRSLEELLTVKVLDRKAIEKERMGGLLAVSRGSAEEPRFVALEHRGGKKDDPFVESDEQVVERVRVLPKRPASRTANS